MMKQAFPAEIDALSDVLRFVERSLKHYGAL